MSTYAVIHTRRGEVVIRDDCNCGLCKSYREQQTTIVRTREENQRRAGVRRSLEQLRDGLCENFHKET